MSRIIVGWVGLAHMVMRRMIGAVAKIQVIEVTPLNHGLVAGSNEEKISSIILAV